MEERGPTACPAALPKYLSVTGEVLDLDGVGRFFGNCDSLSNYTYHRRLGAGGHGVVNLMSPTESLHPDRPRDILVAVKRVGGLSFIKNSTLLSSSAQKRAGLHRYRLREVAVLQRLGRHENIVDVFGVAVDNDGLADGGLGRPVHLVMECYKRDLWSIMYELKVELDVSEVKCLAHQLLKGLEFLHNSRIMHRDLKPQNLLLDGQGLLKIADFGAAREFGHMYRHCNFTSNITTLWYQAPEMLLSATTYSNAVDVWSAGLVIGEMLQTNPLAAGKSTLDQLNLTLRLLGSPTAEDLEEFDALGCPEFLRLGEFKCHEDDCDMVEDLFPLSTFEGAAEFLRGMLQWAPRKRLSVAEALGKCDDKDRPAAWIWWAEGPKACKRAVLSGLESRQKVPEHAPEINQQLCPEPPKEQNEGCSEETKNDLQVGREKVLMSQCIAQAQIRRNDFNQYTGKPPIIVILNIEPSVTRDDFIKVMKELRGPLPYCLAYGNINGDDFKTFAVARFATIEETAIFAHMISSLELKGRRLIVSRAFGLLDALKVDLNKIVIFNVPDMANRDELLQVMDALYVPQPYAFSCAYKCISDDVFGFSNLLRCCVDNSFAVAWFHTPEDAAIAMQRLDHFLLLGRRLCVEFSEDGSLKG